MFHSPVRLLAVVAAISVLIPVDSGQFVMDASARADSRGVGSGSRYGIVDRQAPNLTLSNWIDASGKSMGKIHLRDFRGKVVYLYFFQHWCPGCHAHGFPTLQAIARTFEGDDTVALLAVQTAFEGKHINTADKLRQNQIDYNLAVPMAHDGGEDHPRGLPQTMIDFRSGGTPWAVIIDPQGKVVYNHFHIEVAQAVELIRNLQEKNP